jgi:cytochrome oxidase Cu insertion factor (SCO1/SenC/PrrC family)
VRQLPRRHLWQAAAWLLACALLPAHATVPSGGLIRSLPQDWTDDRGQAFDLHGYANHAVVFTMAYATCHRVCPATMQKFEGWQRQFDAEHRAVDFIIVGYAPETDDVHAWHRYRQSRHLDRSNWHFLIGTSAAVHAFARSLGFEFWKMDDHVLHDDRVVFIDSQGTLTVNPSPGAMLARTN